MERNSGHLALNSVVENNCQAFLLVVLFSLFDRLPLNRISFDDGSIPIQDLAIICEDQLLLKSVDSTLLERNTTHQSLPPHTSPV